MEPHRRPQLPEGLTAEEIVAIAARHGGRNVRVFGSRARGEARPDSDLDLLVDMEPGRSLLDLIGIEQDLSERAQLKVDVHTFSGLKVRLRTRVQEEALSL